MNLQESIRNDLNKLNENGCNEPDNKYYPYGDYEEYSQAKAEYDSLSEKEKEEGGHAHPDDIIDSEKCEESINEEPKYPLTGEEARQSWLDASYAEQKKQAELARQNQSYDIGDVSLYAQEVSDYFVELETNYDDSRAGELADKMELVIKALDGAE